MKIAKELIDKYRRGLCSPEEIQLLQKWFHELKDDEEPSLSESELVDAKAQFSQQFSRHVGGTKYRYGWYQMVAAASIVLFLSIGSYFFLTSNPASPDYVELAEVEHDVAPGTQKAVITLPNGHSYELGESDHGTITEEAGLSITRTLDGEIIYVIKDQNQLSSSTNGVSRIETPPGAQHQLRLPDGTKVWLNAASSIEVPSGFAVDSERVVELTGEAYFEVTRDENRPFKVRSQGQVVRVLGTAFNINSYADEGVTKTTLIEGSVQVLDTRRDGEAQQEVILVPGEQATLTGGGLQVKAVNMDQAVDWKNGDFIFQQETLAQILRRVARWYDIDVHYDAGVDRVQTFSGQVSRDKKLSEVLMILEATGEVIFSISDKSVVASKQ